MIFIDSNVFLYVLDKDSVKASIASGILAEIPYLNSQVVVEVLNVCKRKFGYEKKELVALWEDLVEDTILVPIYKNTHLKGLSLIKKYDFQIFDAIIVASALETGCSTLYTEDMQHGLWVENQLQLINPFKKSPEHKE